MGNEDPAVLLGLMRDVYRSARTFRDKGKIRKVTLSEEERDEVTFNYDICFERGGNIRLDHRRQDPSSRDGPGKDFVIWGKGRTVKVFTRDEVTETPLRNAISSLTFLKNPILPLMVGLLMPGEFHFEKLITSLRDLAYGGMEQVGSHPCHRMVGYTDDDRHMRFSLLLDQESSLIRKFVEHKTFGPSRAELKAADTDARLHAIGVPQQLRPPFKKARHHHFVVEKTIRLEPVIDQPIDPRLFDFKPPRRSRA